MHACDADAMVGGLLLERFFSAYDAGIEWFSAMSKRRLEPAVSTAGELERTYHWLEAAESYRQAVDFVSETDFLRKGAIQERVGHCFHRAAFQTNDPLELKGRMQRALDSYARARGSYAQLAGAQKAARMSRCEAVASYLRLWLTADPSEQRQRLDECLAREATALQAFSEAGEMLEYGRTYGALPHVFWLRSRMEWSGQVRKEILGRGVEWGETAVAALSAVDAVPELARTYYTLATCLRRMSPFIAEPEKQEKNVLKAFEYLHNAADLAERTDNVLFVGLSNCGFAGWSSPEEARKKADEALRCGEKTRDSQLIAWSLSHLAANTATKAYTEEDPAKWKELMDEASKFYERAHNLYSSTPIPSPSLPYMDFPYGWVAYYLSLAIMEPVLEKRQDFLKKAEEAGADALRVAESSCSPDYILKVLTHLGSVHIMCARLDADLTERRHRIATGLKFKGQVRQIRDEITPFDFQPRGVSLTTLATTAMFLADAEPDPKARQRLLEEASVSMEKGLKSTGHICYIPKGSRLSRCLAHAPLPRNQ